MQENRQIHTSVVAVQPPFEAEQPSFAEAGQLLRAGGLVAFATETVYGLGANALDARAVERIFLAKGRPTFNPLIVHVLDTKAAQHWAQQWPDVAERVAAQYWPGPLTLVLPRTNAIPDIVTAGGPTVALRVPAHPAARALLKAAGVPVAAPSANRSSHLSPTLASHVLRDLEGQIDLILDAGPTPGGIESTVLDVTVTPPRILRPGLVSLTDLEILLGTVELSGTSSDLAKPASTLASPGLLERHYAPRTPLVLVSNEVEARRLLTSGETVGWLTGGWWGTALWGLSASREQLPADPQNYASELYAALHRLDEVGLERIVVARPPDGPEWLAIHDRLRRAASSGL